MTLLFYNIILSWIVSHSFPVTGNKIVREINSPGITNYYKFRIIPASQETFLGNGTSKAILF